MEDQYKLIVKGSSAKLYDIPNDHSEKSDLAKSKPEVLARMQAELEDWKSGVMEELKLVE